MQNANFKELPPIFQRMKRIAAVYVFGSTATGRDHRDSDLDLAIVTKKTISGSERLRIETNLSSRLGRDVDLVVFGQAAPLLQHQILKYGNLICENDPAERVRQEVRARSEYLDTRTSFGKFNKGDHHGRQRTPFTEDITTAGIFGRTS